MQILGLTGGVASGKSTATDIFKNKGVPVLDCDAIVHNLQANDVALKAELQKIFPTAFVDDSLDRRILSDLASVNPSLLTEIERITLPYVYRELTRLKEQYEKAKTPLIVIDAPLLFEKGLDKECDDTICLYVSPVIQKERYLKRSNATQEKLSTILSKQMSVEEKKKKATYLIVSDNLENLSNQINAIVHALTRSQMINHEEQIGFYAGSFDPLTRGHWNLICDAICRCDKIYVGIGLNPNKVPLFSAEERVKIVHQTIDDFMKSYQYRHVTGAQFSEAEKKAYEKLHADRNIVEPMSYSGLTIDAALRVGATVLLRGERNAGDHEYETALTTVNQILLRVRNRDLGSMTLTPVNQFAVSHISSSSVKMLCGSGEFIAAEEYVSPNVHNMLMAKTLYPIFEKTSQELGIVNSENIKKEYDRIVLAHTQNRIYHNLSHIAAGLNYLNIYEALGNPLSADDKKALVMGVFYHDFVQGNNAEDLSKQAMHAYLGETSADVAQKVDCLIDATKHMEKTTLNPLQQVMSDIDLAILGSAHRYPVYAQKIRQEYVQYQDTQFAEGRMQVLEKLASKKPIYHTPFFNQMFETMAHANIGKEQNLWQSVLLRSQQKQR